MKYNKLGGSDIDVSLICLGSMTWGEQNTEVEGFAQMDLALDMGVNFFDVAEMYPVPPSEQTRGQSEIVMGKWLAQKGCRDKVVVATKVTGRSSRNSGMGHIRGGPRLSKAHIFEAVEGSLQRLQTDYIDLYQVHWPERSTNFFGQLEYEHKPEEDGIAISETLMAMDELVRQGKVRNIGISNETPWGMLEYLRLASEQNLTRIVSIQNPYNLLNRAFDIGCAEISIREQVGLLAYSPLAFGALSGKYLGGARPKGARLTLYDRFKRYLAGAAESATQAYVDIAKRYDIDPSQLALAFVNQNQALTSNIIGATNLDQLKANIESVDISLSDELVQAVNAVHYANPNPAP